MQHALGNSLKVGLAILVVPLGHRRQGRTHYRLRGTGPILAFISCLCSFPTSLGISLLLLLGAVGLPLSRRRW
jgi:hypothetical protein